MAFRMRCNLASVLLTSTALLTIGPETQVCARPQDGAIVVAQVCLEPGTSRYARTHG
jgi:hypothetical protein